MKNIVDKPIVLHISVDYPNIYRPVNTVAVKNFVEECDALDHYVFALTRTTNPFRVGVFYGDDFDNNKVISLKYWGLPFGVFLGLSMWIVAIRIRSLVVINKIKPAVIHAHKFTFEGISAWLLSCWLDIPLVISVRGEADSKILKYKPHYYWILQKILDRASRVYFVSAWFAKILNNKFSLSSDRQFILPNFVKLVENTNIANAKSNRLVSIFDLNVYRKKGLDRLLPAFKKVLIKFPDAHLDIIGRGDVDVVNEISILINTLGLGDKVSLLGSMGNQDVLNRLPNYAAMVLPSHNETFGMVYVESLLAGVPILHSHNTGIDGFIDFVEARVVIDPLDENSIFLGISDLLDNQEKYHSWLIVNRSKVFSVFDKSNYVDSYSKFVISVSQRN